jgi:hypothetical protein
MWQSAFRQSHPLVLIMSFRPLVVRNRECRGLLLQAQLCVLVTLNSSFPNLEEGSWVVWTLGESNNRFHLGVWRTRPVQSSKAMDGGVGLSKAERFPDNGVKTPMLFLSKHRLKWYPSERSSLVQTILFAGSLPNTGRRVRCQMVSCMENGNGLRLFQKAEHCRCFYTRVANATNQVDSLSSPARISYIAL